MGVIIISQKNMKITCCFCGCLCDDIDIIVENNSIKKVERACILGKEKIFSINKKRNFSYYVKKDGKMISTSLDEGIEKIAKMLIESEKPLLYGWSNTSCEAQKIGLKIASLIKGVWDNTTSVCHGPTSIAISEGGISSATLGEIKNRADTIIYWGANPLEAHPRHLKRYSYLSRGRFINKEKPRKMIVIDVRKTKTAKIADKFIQINPNSDYQFISIIQMALKGDLIEDEEVGISKRDLEELIKILKETKFGVIFFGLGLTMTGYGFVNVDATLSLIRQLSEIGKWVCMPMRGHYNVNGANIVAAYQAGFPYGIDFSSGKAYYNPGETTTADIILNNDFDLIMSVAADPIGTLPYEISCKCAENKIIAIDPFNSITTEVADIIIPCAISGIEAEGTAYRMDGVPIPLKSCIKNVNGLLSDEEILLKILNKIKELKSS